ncbi:MAG: hypothetical protein GWN58_23900 [Anaerolineae bacterium]|nr:hypothetical protein [Anaerolineae bacterium]
MNKQRTLVLFFALLCGLVLASGALAGGISSDRYAVPWNAHWGGGGLSSSDNYAVNGTVGQGAIGWIESANYGVRAGYWYGAIVEYRIYLPLVLRNAA